MLLKKAVVHQPANSWFEFVRVRAVAATLVLQTCVDSKIGKNISDLLESCSTHWWVIWLSLESADRLNNGYNTWLNKLRLWRPRRKVAFSAYRPEERRLKFRMRRAVRGVQLDRYVDLRQMSVKRWPNYAPL